MLKYRNLQIKTSLNEFKKWKVKLWKTIILLKTTQTKQKGMLRRCGSHYYGILPVPYFFKEF